MKKDWLGRPVGGPELTADHFVSALEAAQHYCDFILWPADSPGKVEKIVVTNARQVRFELHCTNGVVVEIPRDHSFFTVFGMVIKREMSSASETVAKVKAQQRAEELA